MTAGPCTRSLTFLGFVLVLPLVLCLIAIDATLPVDLAARANT